MDLVFAPSQIETWPIDRLRPYARNAKIHGTDQVAKIAASMAEFGWTVPCLVAEDGDAEAPLTPHLGEMLAVSADGHADRGRREGDLLDERAEEAKGRAGFVPRGDDEEPAGDAAERGPDGVQGGGFVGRHGRILTETAAWRLTFQGEGNHLARPETPGENRGPPP